ncbi:MAG: hypothetical protein U9N52_13090 [Campylobacterota bacterium]|nr:hypothetical protein [Campylobacterota bacterium]
MKTLTLLLLLTTSLLFGESAKYDVTFSVFGKIGEADVTMERTDSTYLITIDSKTTGTAADLSNNRKEKYISQGSVIAGRLVPDVLTIERSTDDKLEFTSFLFDHNDHNISVEKAKVEKVTKSSIDLFTLSVTRTKHDTFSASQKYNDFYTQNDIVSLFFNASHYLKEMHPGDEKTLQAVGVSTDNGEVAIAAPKQKQLHHMKKVMKGDHADQFVRVGVSKDYFEDENGALLVSLSPDTFPQEAMMESILMFGDIRGIRVYDNVARK